MKNRQCNIYILCMLTSHFTCLVSQFLVYLALNVSSSCSSQLPSSCSLNINWYHDYYHGTPGPSRTALPKGSLLQYIKNERIPKNKEFRLHALWSLGLNLCQRQKSSHLVHTYFQTYYISNLYLHHWTLHIDNSLHVHRKHQRQIPNLSRPCIFMTFQCLFNLISSS